MTQILESVSGRRLGVLIAAVLLAVPLVGAASPAGGAATPSASPTPSLDIGWRWELEPTTPRDGWLDNGWTRFVPSGIVTMVGGTNGAVHVQHVRTAGGPTSGIAAIEYDVRLLDADGAEIRTGWSMRANDRFIVHQYTARGTADGTPAVHGIAVAALDEAGRRARAAHAADAAAAVGATALPLPVVGEPFPFDLPTIDGGRVRSADLRGQVVVIDCWATWCTPCLEKMPELKTLIERYGDRGLEVIGVTFDEEAEPAQRMIADRALAWPHVHAAGSADGYDGDLWGDLTTITTIPHLFVVDRDGVLRADVRPEGLAASLAALFPGDDDAP